MPKSRPKHLNLLQIRLPMPAFVSILHRVSGALLFLLIPLILYVLGGSLQSADSFVQMKDCLSYPVTKLAMLVVLWSFLHHFFAGIRHLVMDHHIGLELEAARASSKVVMVISIGLTIIIGVQLW
jgi:succinate dehydrogenase / fumarate reductase cytochrome b subunit